MKYHREEKARKEIISCLSTPTFGGLFFACLVLSFIFACFIIKNNLIHWALKPSCKPNPKSAFLQPMGSIGSMAGNPGPHSTLSCVTSTRATPEQALSCCQEQNNHLQAKLLIPHPAIQSSEPPNHWKAYPHHIHSKAFARQKNSLVTIIYVILVPIRSRAI